MSDLLKVEDLAVEFRIAGSRRRTMRAVDGVSFSVAPGETVALVGESGSGKSTIGRSILGLTPPRSGRIEFEGRDITHRTRAEQRSIARDLQVVFQDPYSSLNPAKTIGQNLSEPLRAQGMASSAAARERMHALLRQVGLPADSPDRYPSGFSGGQRQRIAIARALILGPKLIVCDEPTSALDVSTQAAVLQLLRDLRHEFQVSYLFITHDLAVVRHFADRVLVLRQGRLVEEGDVEQICENPQHPYTRELIATAPVPDPVLQRARREARLRGWDETDQGSL
ncbi:ATP-binding cassette domain-containing protein [Microbacterium sp.]|uniref:ATP-binding cassette domain-containing protein n=1 Tax=Microbacterium sp. TaxID=51671 RepID=UPI00092C1DC9|nr:ATP-binding cassette domain-containing protein [Microbacterium sp.]MBN9192026.1 ABC transporter ATP-binding protein [Microbacterium sp.]OJU58283.1 MAG: peptide ABC transporter ATP-binding protein [Microbacterium sp. 70-38]